MQALDEDLRVHVQHAALLALDGTVDRIDAAQDASAGHGVAAEGIRAGSLRSGAVGAIRAEAHAKEVPERQEHEGAEALHARQRIPGQQCTPLVVGRQLGRQGFGAEPVELHIELGLVPALQARGLVVGERRVGGAHSGQAEHEGRVSLGGREGQEDRQAVADAVGVRLVPHGGADLVAARSFAGPRLAIVQDLLGRVREAVHEVQLSKHAVDRLHLAADVAVLAGAKLVVQLPHALEDPVLVVAGIRRGIHDGVPLQVHHGAEQVVPDGKPEGPVPPKLGLDAHLHGGRPVLDVD